MFLAGAFGLAAMLFLPQPAAEERESVVVEAEAEDAVLSERADAMEDSDGPVLVKYAAPGPSVPMAEELVEFCAAHVTEQRSFVLFSRGSCVLVSEPSGDPVADAVKMLQSCAESSARFVPERTRDGGMIIGFKDPVFHRFSEEELETLAPWLNQVAPALMTPEETMKAGDGWQPPYHARVGLLARRRLLEDAATPVAVRVVRAKAAATAAK